MRDKKLRELLGVIENHGGYLSSYSFTSEGVIEYLKGSRRADRESVFILHQKINALAQALGYKLEEKQAEPCRFIYTKTNKK